MNVGGGTTVPLKIAESLFSVYELIGLLTAGFPVENCLTCSLIMLYGSRKNWAGQSSAFCRLVRVQVPTRHGHKLSHHCFDGDHVRKVEKCCKGRQADLSESGEPIIMTHD
jgi:hypothetical protein